MISFRQADLLNHIDPYVVSITYSKRGEFPHLKKSYVDVFFDSKKHYLSNSLIAAMWKNIFHTDSPNPTYGNSGHSNIHLGFDSMDEAENYYNSLLSHLSRFHQISPEYVSSNVLEIDKSASFEIPKNITKP
jgi:hypothetical protein